MSDQNQSIVEALSHLRIIKRNFAEHRIQRRGDVVEMVLPQESKHTIDESFQHLELILSDLLDPNQPLDNVTIQRISAQLGGEVQPEQADQAAPQQSSAIPAQPRSAANLQRDLQIRQMQQSSATHQQSAIGTNRDVKSRTVDVKHPFEQLPESELRTNNLLLPEIPGTNMRPTSPYQRLTSPDNSEFARIFSKSPFTPDCDGFITFPHAKFKWHNNHNLRGMQPLDIVRLPQGFYGRSTKHGGPEYAMIRLDKAAVLWNLEHGNENVRIFYIGRSNVSGYWYTPDALTMEEQISVVAGLADLRKRLEAESRGEVYVPPARLRD